MNVDHGIEVRLGHFVEVDVLRIAGVIHEVVEPFAPPTFKRLADIRNEPVEGTQCTRVEAKCGGPSTHLLDFANDGLGFGLIRVIGKDHVDAASGKINGSVATHAATSTRDDRCSLGFDCLARHFSAPFCFLRSSYDNVGLASFCQQ